MLKELRLPTTIKSLDINSHSGLTDQGFTIGKYDYIYEGNVFNTTGTIKSGLVYNMTDSNILSELNNAILYKGIADFDTEDVFREYFK